MKGRGQPELFAPVEKCGFGKKRKKKSYAKFLLETMPPYLAEHYQKKIDKFLEWWHKEGVEIIPDFEDPKREAKRDVPSWRRICKVLLKNDYWCKGLSFAQTKKELEKQVEMITRYNKEL